jgi:hypothetical protein
MTDYNECNNHNFKIAVEKKQNKDLFKFWLEECLPSKIMLQLNKVVNVEIFDSKLDLDLE